MPAMLVFGFWFSQAVLNACKGPSNRDSVIFADNVFDFRFHGGIFASAHEHSGASAGAVLSSSILLKLKNKNPARAGGRLSAIARCDGYSL
jgi:hypothetical protein